MRLCEALTDHVTKDLYPGHMPGHKGNERYSFLKGILKYDITEIDGMDNLHDPVSVILESQKFAASLYGADETFFLINGSTVGVICAILSVTDPGDEILIARNSHRCVYNSVLMNRLRCTYVYPAHIREQGMYGAVDAGSVEEALTRNKNIKAVVITSPTYEGISSDIEAIAGVVHDHGAVLIVDAAHGAHFGFHKGFPASAVAGGADIVINSVHKTLPSPTQTALLHVKGERIDRDALKDCLDIYQTSSPSYLLMAGIDNCMTIIDEHGAGLFEEYLTNIAGFEKAASGLKRISYLSRDILKKSYLIDNADPCKIVLSTEGCDLTGLELYDLLRKSYGIQPEMATDDHCLLIMTIMDTKEGFIRLENALKCIDEKILPAKGDRKEKNKISDILYGSRPVKKYEMYEMKDKPVTRVRLSEAAGNIAATPIMLYPPGIPVLVPGEQISSGMAEGLEAASNLGLNVTGMTKNKEIKVYGQDLLYNR